MTLRLESKMHIAVSTGTFYRVPFPKALELIKTAGFEYIEVLQHWNGGEGWEMAQHIAGIKPKDVLRMVADSGLKISTLHDGGGVIEQGKNSTIAPSTYEYLEYGAREIPCVVLHTPHRRTDDARWWAGYRNTATKDLRALGERTLVCVENMIPIGTYQVPLLDPQELLDFAIACDAYINIDTTHCAQSATDIVEAASILRQRTRTLHLSDFANGKSHVFVGEGSLNLMGCIAALDLSELHAITIECDIAFDPTDEQRTIERLKQAYRFTMGLIRVDDYSNR